MKYIYSGASQKLWAKATTEDKKLARSIYRKCNSSTKKKETFRINRPANIIMNAIEVIFFPYDDNDGRSWWWVDSGTDSSDGKIYDREIEISIKQFHMLVARNDIAGKEIARIKKYLRLNKLTPRERVKAIHDYICEDVQYDYSYNGKTSLYDALFAKTVVCVGYSTALKALCDTCGVVCDIVSNENHAWNRVFIDNEWLYIDATWDDANNYKKFFMLPENDFYKIHPKHTDVDKDVWVK